MREHGLELFIEHSWRLLVGVKELRREHVNVAVPEARGDGEAGAVVGSDGACEVWAFDGCGGTDRGDLPVVDEDRCIVDGRLVWSGVDRCVNELQVGRASSGRDNKAAEGKKSSEADGEEAHGFYIRSKVESSSELYSRMRATTS